MSGPALTSSISFSSLNLRFEQRYFGQLELIMDLSVAVLTSPARLLLVRLATLSPTDAETCRIAMLSAYLRQILLNLVLTHLFFLTCTAVASFLSSCPVRHPNRPHSQLLLGTAGQFPKTPWILFPAAIPTCSCTVGGLADSPPYVQPSLPTPGQYPHPTPPP